METAMNINCLVHVVEDNSITQQEMSFLRSAVRKYLQDESPPWYQRTQPVIRRKIQDYEVTLS